MKIYSPSNYSYVKIIEIPKEEIVMNIFLKLNFSKLDP